MMCNPINWLIITMYRCISEMWILAWGFHILFSCPSEDQIVVNNMVLWRSKPSYVTVSFPSGASVNVTAQVSALQFTISLPSSFHNKTQGLLGMCSVEHGGPSEMLTVHFTFFLSVLTCEIIIFLSLPSIVQVGKHAFLILNLLDHHPHIKF